MVFKSQFILVACFLPLVFIYIVMKLAVWLQEPFRKRGPYVENPYADLDEEEEEYGDKTDYR